MKSLKNIKLLLLDVDGVLTDGTIVYTDEGTEIKSFNVKDGLGIKMLIDAGIHVGIITARRSGALRHRCEDLGIELVLTGVDDKGAALNRIKAATGMTADQMAYAGDDLADLSLMSKVGMCFAVADADHQVIDAADVVTRAPGGKGAVREICELILKEKGVYEKAVQRFLEEAV